MVHKYNNSDRLQAVRRFRVNGSVTDASIFDFLSALDCPRALTVWLLYLNKEHDQLSDLECNPNLFLDRFKFRDAYLATNFLSKSNFLEIEVSKSDAAFKKFFEYEDLCKATNARFRKPSFDTLFKGANVYLLNATKRKIEAILGEFDPEEYFENANWGPGVTTMLSGQHVSASNKFQSESGITSQLYALVGDAFRVAYPLWTSRLALSQGTDLFTEQRGNKIVTVPKNSKTDRVIAVEPGINLWFQKSIGSIIRRKLKRYGIDLNTQERNQELARIGSLTNNLATIDFSSASDSISLELVRELLPPRWFSILDLNRSHYGVHDSKLIKWEKFSSMGNGFTFELESLIFFAASLAVFEYQGCEGNYRDVISVFGDDVILPRTCASLFSQFSEFLGFRVNLRKSFSEGNFRESCGSHYFCGFDVKPIFLKEKLRYVQSIFKLANSIRWLSHRYNSHYGCGDRFRICWVRLFCRVPKPLRLFNSVGFGDGGFIGNFDEACPVRLRNGLEGYSVVVLRESGVTQHFEEEGLLLANLKVTTKEQASKNTYTLRGRTRISFGKLVVRQWYDLGPWL
jgi:hypothetical protein